MVVKMTAALHSTATVAVWSNCRWRPIIREIYYSICSAITCIKNNSPMIFVAPISKDVYPSILQAFFPNQWPANENSSWMIVVTVNSALARATSQPYIADRPKQRRTSPNRRERAFLSEILPEGMGRHGRLMVSSALLRLWLDTLHCNKCSLKHKTRSVYTWNVNAHRSQLAISTLIHGQCAPQSVPALIHRQKQPVAGHSLQVQK